MVQSQSNQFTSRLFMVSKKDRSLCPVINLKSLNTCITKQNFKIERIHTQKRLDVLRIPDSSVATAKHHRKFLRFVWKDTTIVI